MRGLIEKDMRLTLGRKQTLMIFLVMSLVMGMSVEGGFFMIVYLTLFAAILAVGTISYDEYDNGFAFLMTLPVERKTYVKEKYLLSLIFVVIGWCFGTILYVIGSAIRHKGTALTETLPVLLMLIPILYFSASIMIPVHLKFGSEKGKMVLFILYGMIALLIFGSTKLFGGSNFIAGLVKTLGALSPAVVFASLAALCMIAVYVSYLCSVRIMEKKEF